MGARWGLIERGAEEQERGLGLEAKGRQGMVLVGGEVEGGEGGGMGGFHDEGGVRGDCGEGRGRRGGWMEDERSRWRMDEGARRGRGQRVTCSSPIRRIQTYLVVGHCGS